MHFPLRRPLPGPVSTNQKLLDTHSKTAAQKQGTLGDPNFEGELGLRGVPNATFYMVSPWASETNQTNVYLIFLARAHAGIESNASRKS